LDRRASRLQGVAEFEVVAGEVELFEGQGAVVVVEGEAEDHQDGDAFREAEGLGLVGEGHAGAEVFGEVEFVAQCGEGCVELGGLRGCLVFVPGVGEDGERDVGAVELA
jgi:hypothetical protein